MTRLQRVYTDEEVRSRLTEWCVERGTSRAARILGVASENISHMKAGRRSVPESVLNAMGLTRETRVIDAPEGK